MKKLIFIASLVLLAMNAQARDKFDGCGLGWEVVDGKTVLATTTRGTTNAFVPPVFGMTTGTLGCDQFEGIAMNEKDSASYVAQNYETIRAELAMGRGEYVDTTAQYFNCDSEKFGKHIQKNYEGVVAPTQSGLELHRNLKSEATKICS